jgi:hypothetical protein
MTSKEMVEAIRDAVNGTNILPAAKSDCLDKDAPAVSVQLLPGERWATRYIDGSGTREQPFAVLYRTAGDDTSGRQDAAAALYDLADALEALGEITGLGTIEGSDTPSLTERDDHGQEVWRETFLLTQQVS